MATSSLSLRIAAIFITFLVSVLGFVTPLIKHGSDLETPFFNCMKACGAGVMLGIALIHLLPEGSEMLEEVEPNYNLGFAMTAFGIILVLAVEQCSIMYSQYYLSSKNREPVRVPVPVEDSGAGDSKITNSGVVEIELGATHHKHDSPECNSATVHSSHNHDHSGGDAIAKLMDENSRIQDWVTIYAMELSIALHSIIIGVDIGLLSDSGDFGTLVTLIIAISFHQYIEGFGLAVNIIGTSAKFEKVGGLSLLNSDYKILGFVLIFAITVPIGIFIGIMTSTGEEMDEDLWAKGLANTLAAGSLMYISVGEMIGHYFIAPTLSNQPMVKLGMLCSLTLGVGLTALLAYWI